MKLTISNRISNIDRVKYLRTRANVNLLLLRSKSRKQLRMITSICSPSNIHTFRKLVCVCTNSAKTIRHSANRGRTLMNTRTYVCV